MSLVSKTSGIKFIGLLTIILFISTSGCSSNSDTDNSIASENAQLAASTHNVTTTTNANSTDNNTIAAKMEMPNRCRVRQRSFISITAPAESSGTVG